MARSLQKLPDTWNTVSTRLVGLRGSLGPFDVARLHQETLQCHKTLVAPFLHAIENTRSDIVTMAEAQVAQGVAAKILRVGETYAVLAYKKNANPQQLELYPVFKQVQFEASDFRTCQTLEDFLQRVYGQDTVSGLVCRWNEHEKNAQLHMGRVALKAEASYVQALGGALLDAFLRAQPRSTSAESVFEGADGARGASLSKALQALGVDGQPLRHASVAPAPIRGDEVVSEHSWKGMPVLITAAADSMRVWLGVGTGADLTWLEARMPADGVLPSHGAASSVVGDDLWLVGGMKRHALSDERWACHLPTLLAQGANPWRRAEGLQHPKAFGVASPTADGSLRHVGGYWTTDARKNLGWETNDTQSREHEILSSAKRAQRGAPPSSIAAASCVSWGTLTVYGPGAALDGKVMALDEKDHVWVMLPALPEALGCGQMLRDGCDLYYSGGLKGDKSDSQALYRLDMLNLEDGWKKVLESPYTRRNSKLIFAKGRLASLVLGAQAVYFWE